MSRYPKDRHDCESATLIQGIKYGDDNPDQYLGHQLLFSAFLHLTKLEPQAAWSTRDLDRFFGENVHAH
jgi:hypothetical protein